ncbi:MAG TPA: orotidine-5'-phosphate decarboxylase [Gemmatimonadales bacterium]|nr:orotidine-5'-phosphate decarboxylase [Gemmatimonadales bacterium]
MAEIVVALDHEHGPDALELVDRLPGLRWVKVGPTLLLSAGTELLEQLAERGLSVFLDLKWHDIPHQVAGAVRAAVGLGVQLATVHALGGEEMLAAAREAAAGRLHLVAVSVLTSHDATSYAATVGRDVVIADEVQRLAAIARRAGVDGMVASPAEVRGIRNAWPDALLVVPGIRPAASASDDQRRTATPEEAVAAGATHLVIGRPITRSDDPLRVYQGVCDAVG